MIRTRALSILGVCAGFALGCSSSNDATTSDEVGANDATSPSDGTSSDVHVDDANADGDSVATDDSATTSDDGTGTDATSGDASSSDAGTDAPSDTATDAGSITPTLPPEICTPPIGLASTTGATVVGTGTPASCTFAQLSAAVANGGAVTFDCGASGATIVFASELVVKKDVVVDGGGIVTFSGAHATRLFGIHGPDTRFSAAKLTLQRVTLTQGASTADGGAVFVTGGTLVVIDSVLTDNHGATVGQDTSGGAIHADGAGSEVTVVRSIFKNNSCSNGGAIGLLYAGLTLVNSTLDGNVASGTGGNPGNGGNGGAISMDGESKTLSVCGSALTANQSHAFGGAIFRTGYHTEPTLIDRTTIDGNSTPDGDPSMAGGLYLQGLGVKITSSTISNNKAKSAAGIAVFEHTFNGNPVPSTFDLTNVTVANNDCYDHGTTATGLAGGIFVNSSMVTGTLTNCTIAGNVAQFGAGITDVSPLVLKNTIVANTALNVYNPLNCTGASFNTPPATGANDLQWPQGPADMACVTGITYVDPKLDTLKDNGGPTKTMALLAGSPAIGVGAGCPATDQRGQPRTKCDIGAVAH